MNLDLRSSFVHTSQVIFTCYKILQHGASDFASPLKQGVLRIIITLKSPLSSAGFERANLGSNFKHANHYTTEATRRKYKSIFLYLDIS
jgi:hypothetical protein